VSENAANTTIDPPDEATAVIFATVKLVPSSAIDLHAITEEDGTYRVSALQLGRSWSGVVVVAGREELIRLFVALGEHLHGLDKNDAADRKVAEGGES